MLESIPPAKASDYDKTLLLQDYHLEKSPPRYSVVLPVVPSGKRSLAGRDRE
jgi:hypothetical protein